MAHGEAYGGVDRAGYAAVLVEVDLELVSILGTGWEIKIVD